MMLTLTVALADSQVQDDAGLFTADELPKSAPFATASKARFRWICSC